MSSWVSETAKRAARTVNLYDFLLVQHPDQVKPEGDSLRLRANHSVSVKRGYSGYTDFSDGTTGNTVDFLVHFLGYSFPDAVAALCVFAGCAREPRLQDIHQKGPPLLQDAPNVPQRVFSPPEPLQGPCRQLFAYLTQTRGIPCSMVQQLLSWGVLYQSRDHANLVFIDPARTFVELRGTSQAKPFHQVAFSDPAAFWWFKSQGLDSIPTVAFVCEAAIDAISLYLLRTAVGVSATENGLYCSIGGVANQQRIDRIQAGMSAGGCPTVLAVDNDAAGEKCRQRNPACPRLVPHRKDWNADWLAQFSQTQKEG